MLILFLAANAAAIIQTPVKDGPAKDAPAARPPLLLNLTDGEAAPAKPKAAPPSAAPAQSPATATASVPPARKACAAGCLSAIEAVTFADTVAPKAGIAGEFDMTIASLGEMQGRFYLNSEEDYRDRNCLSVALSPSAAQSLGGTKLADLSARLKGKRIAVQGIARRVRIDLMEKGQQTGSYYYQVHVLVTDPRQIVLR